MRFKVTIAILAGICIVASLPLMQQAALHLVADIPVAHAACGSAKQAPLGGNDCGSSRDDGGPNKSMAVTATDPNGNNLPGGSAIYRGETITVTLSYTVATPANVGSVWDAWMDFDVTNDTCSNTTAWTGCFSGASGGSTRVDLDDNLPKADNGKIEQDDNCPSFYNNYDSPYADISESGEGALNGDEYPWSDPYPGVSGHSTCLEQGESVVWHGVHMDTVGQKNYSINYTVNPSLNRASVPICIGGNISLGDVGAGGNNGGDLYYRTNANSLCLTANVPTTISGNVQSDPNAASGKRFESQSYMVSVSADCKFDDMPADPTKQSADYSQWLSTDGNGAVSFGWFEGEPFCMQPNTQADNSAAGGSVFNWSYDGTQYDGVINTYPAPNGSSDPNDPSSSESGRQDWDTGKATSTTGWDTSQACGTDHCGGYNFYWLPTASTPTISKCSGPGGSPCLTGGGNSLTPGANDSFTVTIKNNQDANLTNVDLNDYIPINIDPNSVTPGSMTISAVPSPSGTPPAGWGWGFCGGSWCQTTATYPYPATGGAGLLIGRNGISAGQILGSITNVSSSWINSSSGRPLIGWSFETLPAYSQVSFSFSGTVKGASQIGVVGDPGAGNYCANSSGTAVATEPNYDDATATLATCGQDYANGREGVWNAALVSVGSGVANVAETYDPIPPPPVATSICIGKSYVGVTHGGNDIGVDASAALPTTSQPCGVSPPVYSGSGSVATTHYVYLNPNGGVDDSGTFSTNVQATSSGKAGFLIYTTDDQAPTTGALPTEFDETSCTGNCTVTNRHINWGTTQRIDFTAAGTFTSATPAQNFGVSWDNITQPIGGGVCNTAYVTAVDYSTVPATTQTIASNPICVRHVNIILPGIQANNGNVLGGATNPGAGCIIAPTGAPLGVHANPSKGQYVVTAANGNVAPFASNNGSSSLSQNGEGPVCVSQLTGGSGSVLTYAHDNPAKVTAGLAGNSLNQATSNSITNGNVVEVNGDVHIGGGGAVDISGKRYTLYVNGNIYVNNNVTDSASNGSVAIIATGNIYVNPSTNLNGTAGVTQLSGLYYAGGYLNTCQDDQGNTLRFAVPGGAELGEPQCGGVLTVNGALLAQDLRLNRTPPTSPYGEVINLPPQMYLDTPPGLASTDITGLVPSYSIDLPRY